MTQIKRRVRSQKKKNAFVVMTSEPEGDTSADRQQLVARHVAAFESTRDCSRLPSLPFSSTDSRTHVGAHTALATAFGCARYARRHEHIRSRKRTHHSRNRGIDIHACVEHYIFCRHVDVRRGAADAERRKGKRRSRYEKRCERCNHIGRCRKRRCTVWGAAVQKWLDARSLVPVAVEYPVEWHRVAISTQLDIVCMRRDDDCRRVVVVSLKTLGAGDTVPKMNNMITSRIDLPKDVVRTSVPDGEHTRHQLQLLIECLALNSAHNVLPDDAHVLYVRDSPDSSESDVLAGATSADEWWFHVLLRDQKAAEARTTLTHFIVQKLSRCH